VDPRVVSVLDSVLAHHSVGVADVVASSAPVHVQVLDIVSVDGQPVGPDNFAARDLVTEIAALDGSVRPDEIGTPWPIQSPGFFSDATSQGSLHLAFEMPGANAGAGAPAAGAVPGAVPSAVPGAVPGAAPGGVSYAVPGAVPAAVPGAAGAQPAVPVAASAAPASPAAPVAAPVAPQPAPAGGVAAQVAAAPSPAPAAAGASPNTYVDPLPGDARVGRTDMGVDVDLKPGQPIVAPGTSRVLGVMQNWYAGQPYVGLQLLDGPLKGHNYYVAEQINLAVSPGQIVHQGQPIAHFAASGTGIEMGWAGDNWQQTLAQSQGNTGDSSHNNAPAGLSFKHFLDSVAGRKASASPAAAAGAGTPAPQASPAAPVAPAAPTAQAAQASPAAPVSPAPPVTPAVQGAPGTPVAPAAAAASLAPGAPGAGVPGATPEGAVTPGTAQFQAVPSHEHASKLHTVKFMQAVPPPPGSPLAASQQAAAGTPGAAGTPAPPVAGQPVVADVQGAQPGTAVPAGQSGVPALAGQVAAVAPGSVVSVSSSLLTSGQETFAARLAALTGLDPRVVAAWELAEESGSAAQGRQAASNFNWLNIGYFDSGAGHIAFDKAFGDPVSAAEQTARFLKGTWGGASSGIQNILQTVGKPPHEQMMAIANSGWASSHYGGGANLIGTFNELSNMKIETAPAGGALSTPAPPAPPAPPAAPA
jgi:hypothetical protein